MNTTSHTPVKAFVVLFAIIWLLPVAPLWAQNFSPINNTEADRFEVAAGRIQINPALGTYMAGYGADRKSTGQYDALWAKVVVIKTDPRSLAIVTLDNIGLTRPDIMRLRRKIEQRDPLINVVVSSTHTHAGPDVVGIWGPAFWRSGRDEAYIDSLIARVAELIAETSGQLQVVTSRVVSVSTPLEWVENVSEPQLLDTTMSVLQFVDDAGDSVATLTNYACHPTILGPNNTLVSADYVSGFYQTMSQHLSGEHLFLQGSIGGWVQPMQGDRSIGLARDRGADVAQGALVALAAAQDNVYAPLAYVEQVVDVPLENWGFRLLMWIGVLDRETFEGAMRTSVAWFKIGDAEFVTHPGETSPAYSLQSRQLMQSTTSFVMGLSQDAMGYILKPDYFSDDTQYPHREYLASVSVGPQAGPKIMAALKKIVPGK